MAACGEQIGDQDGRLAHLFPDMTSLAGLDPAGLGFPQADQATTEGSGMTSGTRAGLRSHTVVDSPVGPLTLVAANAALAGLYMTEQRHRPAPEALAESIASGTCLPMSGG